MRQVFVPADLPDGALVAPPSAAQLVSLYGETMGTDWRFQGFVPMGVKTAQIEAALAAVFEAVIADFSNWDPGSFISRFNRSDTGTRHVMPPAVQMVLKEAFRLSSHTDGVFDPCLGDRAASLAFVKVPVSVPPVPQGQFQASPGWSQLRMNGNVIEKQAGIALDLSAIAKGYAVDQMAAALSGLGLQSFLVEIGGEFVGRGIKPDGQPWWVALPAQSREVEAPVLALCGLALATSGAGHRVYRSLGQETCHIAGSGTAELSSVSVIADSCMAADGWATALLAMGFEDGLACAVRHGIAALFLRLDGGVKASPILATFLS